MNQALPRALRRLEAEISGASESVQADCLRVERAIYLARMGDLAAARKATDEVRSRYGSRPRVETSGWLALAEGLTRYFDDVDIAARDQILRAQALARSAGLKRLEALSSAWLAHLDFSRLSPGLMRENVERAISLAEPGDHGAIGRVAMVVAYSLHFAGLLVRARPWYQLAHWHATQDGDLSSVSALLHNYASFQLSNLRQAYFQRGIDPKEGAQLLLAAESNQYFDEMVGAKALDYLTPLLRSQSLVLLERFAEAIPDLEAHLCSPRGMDRFRSVYLAEKAWCHLQLGQSEAARTDALASAEIAETGQADERAACHSRLSRIFEYLGDASNANAQASSASRAWLEHELMQETFASEFEGLPMTHPIPTKDAST